MMRWAPRPGAEHCESCLLLGGQVHDEAVWAAAGLHPGCELLLCWDKCKCGWEPVDNTTEEQGDLAAIILLLTALLAAHPHKKPPADERIKEHAMSSAPAPALDEQRATLSASGQVNGAGAFEIIAITAGVGNGWTFPAEVLRASLPLWDGVSTFIDHGSMAQNRSVRDLGGVCSAPAWDDQAAGVRLQLKAAGPSGPLVEALGREMLADTSRPRVGFSADVIFTASKEKHVEKILRVLSLDLVFDPARGGAFIRALNQAGYRQENQMPEQGNTPGAAAPAAPTQAEQLQQDAAALGRLRAEQERQAQLANEAERTRALRVQMCSYLLDSGLAASRLPAVAQEQLRARFAGQVFEPEALTQAIDSQRQLVAALTAGAVVQGPGRIHATYNTADKLQAAVDDLLQAPRDEAAKGLNVARLTGIRELYHMLTGDFDYHGGYYADRAALANTADFTGLVKNAMNKIVVERWAQLGKAGYDWWKKIVVTEHFNSLKSITGTLIGTVASLPTISEGAEYTELAIGDSPETASFTKYGGYIPLTLELIDTDDARKLAAYPRELANAALRNVSALVAAIFTSNSAVGPTMADTGALFNSTALATLGGHLNLLTTALSAAQWEVVSAAVYNQLMLVKQASGYYGTGKKQGINPKYLLVPRALQLTAKQVLYPSLERATQIYTENMQRGEPGDVITVPDWTDTNDWAAVCDPLVAPAIYVGERFGLTPEIFVAGDELSPAVFMNDEHRLKVRHYLAVWVNDFRPLHKENV